ncbi:helix-turn-helix domain-containing protein [Paraclostridium sordellii]|uniref:helix-turn-helix domain-containing protein n=1 Tax=Paraclostridium sordellii TaxID=1505 RepID=UPI0022DEAC45|nr:helix-turn-helix transcriptional regulator [Paeniclostridium sordellii]
MNYKPNIKLIKLHMLKKGYSITKLANKSNLGKSTVSRLINQTGTPRIETIYKIAKELDIEIKDITI